MTYGRVVVVDEEQRPLDEWNDVLDPRFAELVARGSSFDAIAELGGPLYLSATMVRRDAFLRSGGFDPDFDAHEDLDLYLRLARDGAIVAGAGEPVTLYRVHSTNTPSDALYRGTLGVTAKHLAGSRGRRRRCSSGASTRSGRSASSRPPGARPRGPQWPSRFFSGILVS